MRRLRSLFVTTSVIAAFAGFFSAAPSHASAPPHRVTMNSAVTDTRPNIVILINDDQKNTRAVGIPYSSYMPKLTSLVQDKGVLYAKGEVANPNCCPSRAALMTGRYDHNNGVLTQADGVNLDFSTTLQHYLHESGYRTCIDGKFLNQFPIDQRPPDFDKYYFWDTDYYYNNYVNEDGRLRTESKYSTTYWGDKAMSCLNYFGAHPNQPFFFYGAPHAPHTTKESNPPGLAIPEPKYANAPVPTCVQPGEADVSDQPPYIANVHIPPSFNELVCQSQLRALMSLDDQYARIIDALQANGRLANTIIIAMSDNGLLWGEHNRQGKFVPFLPSIQVPLVVRWDGHFPSGVVSNRPVDEVDLAPTILAATGNLSEVTEPLDGESLLQPNHRRVLYNEYFYDVADSQGVPSWAQLHTTKWAYDEYYDSAGNITFKAYYDLVNDPLENDNVLGDKDPSNDPSATRLATLHRQLTAARHCVGAACP